MSVRASLAPASALAGVFVSVLGSACHRVTEVPAPDLSDTQTLLMAFVVDDELLRVDAVALSGDGALPALSRVTSSSVAVYALGYRCGLDVIGVASGAQQLLAMPLDEPTIPLPSRVQRLTISDASEPAWVDDARDSAIVERVRRSLRATEGTACANFGGALLRVPVQLPTGPGLARTIEAAAPLGNGEAFVLTSVDHRRQSWVVSRDGRVREVSVGLEARAEGTTTRDRMAGDGRGNLWHVSMTGTVSRGTIDGGFQVLGVVPDVIDVAQALVVDDGGEPRLFIAAHDGSGERLIAYGGAQSERLRAASPLLTALDARHFLITARSFDIRTFYRAELADGQWSIDEVRPPPVPADLTPRASYVTATLGRPAGGLLALSFHVVGDSLIGSPASSLSHFDGERWTTLPDARGDTVDVAMYPLGPRRVLVSNQSVFSSQAQLRVYEPSVGYCHRIVFQDDRGRDSGDDPLNSVHVVPLDDTRLLLLPSRSHADAEIVSISDGSRTCPAPL